MSEELISIAKSYGDYSLPRISKEEEYELIRLVRKGDVEAKDRLLRSYYPFVILLVKQNHWNKHVPLEDAVQEGMFGLLKAVEMFKPSLGNRLTTYSSWWIRAFVTRYIAETRSNVRIPQHSQQKFKIYAKEMSLNQPVSNDVDGTFLDLLEDDSEQIDITEERKELSNQVRDILDSIVWKKSARKIIRDILSDRLMSDSPVTLEEIGKRHGVCRERVRQVEVEVKTKLRDRLGQLAA